MRVIMQGFATIFDIHEAETEQIFGVNAEDTVTMIRSCPEPFVDLLLSILETYAEADISTAEITMYDTLEDSGSIHFVVKNAKIMNGTTINYPRPCVFNLPTPVVKEITDKCALKIIKEDFADMQAEIDRVNALFEGQDEDDYDDEEDDYEVYDEEEDVCEEIPGLRDEEGNLPEVQFEAKETVNTWFVERKAKVANPLLKKVIVEVMEKYGCVPVIAHKEVRPMRPGDLCPDAKKKITDTGAKSGKTMSGKAIPDKPAPDKPVKDVQEIIRHYRFLSADGALAVMQNKSLPCHKCPLEFRSYAKGRKTQYYLTVKYKSKEDMKKTELFLHEYTESVRIPLGEVVYQSEKKGKRHQKPAKHRIHII